MRQHTLKEALEKSEGFPKNYVELWFYVALGVTMDWGRSSYYLLEAQNEIYIIYINLIAILTDFYASSFFIDRLYYDLVSLMCSCYNRQTEDYGPCGRLKL